MRKSFSHLLLLFFCFITFQNINAQLSKKHFIPPLTSTDGFTDQYIYISTPNNNVSYKITPVGNLDQTAYSGIVSNNLPIEQPVLNLSGNTDFDNDTQLHIPESSIIGNKFTNRGFIIEANDLIYVTIRVRSSQANNGNKNQAGALVSKGNSALGTEFRIGGFIRDGSINGDVTFASIMATEDNTEVTITNATSSSTIININLNEGESYIIHANGANSSSIIGNLITSDKPIVVNSGSAYGSFGNNSGNADYGFDQIVGADKIGSEYILVKGSGNTIEKSLIIAHEDFTEFFINDTSVGTFNAGEYYITTNSMYTTNGNMYINTNKPVFVYQGVGGLGNNGIPSEANQGLFFVPPLSCENRGKVDNIPHIERIGNEDFTGGISIVTNEDSVVKINGSLITTFSGISGPFLITTKDSGKYDTYKVTGLEGNISIESSGELYCAYFNQNGLATSGAFYSGFPSSPEIKFNVAISTLGNCLGNDLELQAANTELFDSFKWYFNDGSGYIDTNETSATLIPSAPGSYQLIGKINCTNTTFKSTEIPVSICPDDYDKDGIIDNIDVDIDNDGILNIDESLGDKIIDLSDINNPTVEDDVTTIITNTFTGDATGNFTSVANNVTTSNATYSLDFNDNINFKLTQNRTTDHTISNNEYFIIKLSQTEKNITLIDPDNQILIDSNFDDEFEDNFTQFSASVIKFKFKADLVGSTSTFQFVANQINNISFEHYNDISSNASTFNGNIGLTCFSLDSDGDGIEDMFDLDTDNDGIPDLYDAYGQEISLAKTDANLDGLDDVFESITTNLDTDGDGVNNYLDYDSDNDGIYDSTEASHGLDTDFNGTIDTFIDINKNGLEDSLENDTTVQTISLKYTIADTDADAIFNFIELDSDADGCNDVIEAGFTDNNNDGILFANSFSVDENGKVKNPNDGYTTPNSNYTTSAPIVVTTFTDVTFCENLTDIITIDSNADSFQWEFSTDGTNWLIINEDDTTDLYQGSTSASLQITNTPFTYDSYQYRVALNRTGNSCGFTSDAITLTVNPKPVIENNPAALFQCDTDSDLQTTFNLTESEISITNETDVNFEYYATELDAINGTPQVADKTSYSVNTNGEAWVKTISNTTACYSISKINLTVSYAPNETFNDTLYQCDDLLDLDGNNTTNNDDKDGITSFDLSNISDKISTDSDIKIEFYETDDDRTRSLNEITETQDLASYRNKNYPFTTGNPVTIFYKLISITNNNCQGIGEFYLEVNKIPEFTVDGEAPSDPIIICAENIPYTLNVYTSNSSYNYQWTNEKGDNLGTTQNINISDAGVYTVTSSTNSCSRSRTITVYKSDFENLEESFVTITDDLSVINSNLNIRIDIPTNPLINEVFQYALEDEDGMTIRSFQDSNVFEDIEGGIYKIIVESKNGCGTSELLVSVIQFPKFFTPNGDRKNDSWGIKGVSNTLYQSNSSINIFNRYGKLVAQTTIDGDGWDGTYNGKLLPSDDYWYSIQLIPVNTDQKPILKKGHFSLIRK